MTSAWAGHGALRRAPAVARPEVDRRDLRDVLHVVERVHDRVVVRDVEDRVLVRRQHAADLVDPLIPRLRTPEIVDVEKAPLQQVGTKLLDLFIAEARRAHVFHEQDRAVVEQRIVEAQHDVVRLAIGLHLDAHERQLRQPHGKVVVGAGIVGAPAAAARLARDAGEEAAAVIERSVEVLARPELRRAAAPEAAARAANPDALRVHGGRGREHRGGEDAASGSNIP